MRRCIPWILALGSLWAQEAPSSARRTFAVVIGLSRYEDPGTTGLKYAHWDARLFAQHLKTVRGGQLPDQNIRLLVDQEATGTQIEKAFRWLATNVGRRDRVFLFISGIGRSTVLSKDGYILPFDRPAEKDPVSLKQLRSWLQNCCGFAEVFLFADLCREQPVFEDIPIVRRIPLDNKINFSVRNLGNAGIGASFGGLLSSREKGKSIEAPERDLPGDNTGAPSGSGYGLFSYYLVQALQAPSKILAAPPREPGAFVEFLGAHVGQLSRKLDQREQRPSAVGRLGVIPADWEKPGTQVRSTAMAPRFPAFPGLLAFNGRFYPPGIAAVQARALAPPLLARFVTAMQDADLHGPGGVRELLASVRAQRPDNFASGEREVFAAAVEDAGQQIVARYGTGDQFPDDPRKLKKRDFELAAALFAEARDLRLRDTNGATARRFCEEERLAVTLPGDPETLALEARRLFSLGRAALSSEDDTVMRPENLDRRDVEEAERRLQCAAVLDSSMPETINALGIAELLLARFDGEPERRFEAAAAHFRQALRMAPNWAYPRHNLALVYAEQGRSSAAEKEIRAAIERTPYYPYLYYNLGLTLQRANKLDGAERSYQDAIRVFDLEIRRYRERARSWTDLPNRARLAREVADALERNQVEAYNALASLHMQRRNFALAEKNYAMALQRDPAHVPARHNLALLYLQSGGKDKAEGLLRANTDFHLSRLKLAEILAAKGQVEEAGRHYEAVLSSLPDNTNARLGVSAAFSALGRTQEAAKVLSWPGGESHRVVQEQLGELNLKLGKNEEACAAFAKAVRLEREQFGARLSGRARRELHLKLKGCPGPAQF